MNPMRLLQSWRPLRAAALALVPLALAGCGADSSAAPNALPNAEQDASDDQDASLGADAQPPDTGAADHLAPDSDIPDSDKADAAATDANDDEAQEAADDGATDAPSADGDGSTACAPAVYGPAGTPIPIVGFGEGTVGGLQPGHDTFHVTSLDDDGDGTLRRGLQTNGSPRIVVFDLDGTIFLQTALLVPSNITVDGRGRSIVLNGKGMVIPGSDEVILVNFAFENVGPDSEDGVQIGSAAPDPSEHVVLDHLRFSQLTDHGSCKYVDEAISVIYGSRFITIAHCKFDFWEKVLLAGNGDAEPSLDAQITLTMHHSYANETGRRHPQARYGKYHFFNNYLDDWRMYGWAFESPYFESFGHQIQDNGRMLLEGEMVRRRNHTYDVGSQANDASRCELGGDLLEHGTWIDPETTVSLNFGAGCAQKEGIVPPYSACIEKADADLRDRVMSTSGNTL
jgi:pectate lyase